MFCLTSGPNFLSIEFLFMPLTELTQNFRGTPERKPRSLATRLKSLFQVLAITRSHTNRVLGVKNPETELGRKEVYDIAKTWLEELNRALACRVVSEGFAPLTTPCLFVSNHVGYIDIPVLMSLTKGVFVAKKEIQSWPFFGRAAESYGTVFLNRKDPVARKKVGEIIAQHLESQKKSIILFPEGTSTVYGADWKRGSIAIAKQFNIPVQPVRIAYRPHHEVAYWGNDTFLPHLWQLLGQNEILASVEFLEPRIINRVDEDTLTMQHQVQNSLQKQLKLWGLPTQL
jgi:1-acyl-sn-glycerol-3-phosphate acyltransferase